MANLLIDWPKFARGVAFDVDYLEYRLPLVELFEGGPLETARVRGREGHRGTTVVFSSMEELGSALRSPAAALTKADIERLLAAYRREPLVLVLE